MNRLAGWCVPDTALRWGQQPKKPGARVISVRMGPQHVTYAPPQRRAFKRDTCGKETWVKDPSDLQVNIDNRLASEQHQRNMERP